MAKPRIFISSTFFDLRQVRADLDRFIRDMGFEPVRNEVGNIPYGKEDGLEEYCYREVSSIDILVAIIGGRFGSLSQNQDYSITQMEIKTALDNNKQVYLFIEKNVFAEFQTFLLNKDNDTIHYKFVDSIKIFKFIEELEKLPQNNSIHQFETAQDIVQYLKEQWAGLFQRFLIEQTRVKEVNLITGLESTARTLDNLVNYITEEKKGNDNVIREILLSNHPAISRLKKILDVKYKVIFSNIQELGLWIDARGYKDMGQDEEFYFWINKPKNSNREYKLMVSKLIFDDSGKLKVMSAEEWLDDLIQVEIIDKKAHSAEPVDDLPF